MEENQTNPKYTIPSEGSLGLLAAGYKGLMVWRMKKINISDSSIRIIPPVIEGRIIPVDKKIGHSLKKKLSE